MSLFLIFINQGLKLKILIDEKQVLAVTQNNLKNIILEKEILFKEYNKKMNEMDLKKEKENFSYFIFNGTEDVFNFINNLIEENNLDLEMIGREVIEKNSETYGEVYFQIRGNEFEIYNFIYDLENSKKFIKFNMNSILIEIDGDKLYLKSNIMYIINNKKNKIDYDYYNRDTFKKFRSRNIQGKRRML